MAAVFPTILPPVIQITTASTSTPYSYVVNQLVTHNAKITKFYISSPGNIPQLSQPMAVVKITEYGIEKQDVHVFMMNIFNNPAIGAIELDMTPYNVVLDGFTFFNMNILPNANFTMIADYEELGFSQLLRASLGVN